MNEVSKTELHREFAELLTEKMLAVATAARADERAAIVKWLRGEAEALLGAKFPNESDAVFDAATAISRGDHLPND